MMNRKNNGWKTQRKSVIRKIVYQMKMEADEMMERWWQYKRKPQIEKDRENDTSN